MRRFWMCGVAMALASPAWAQKNSGPLLPTAPYEVPRPAPRYPPPQSLPSQSLPPQYPPPQSYARPAAPPAGNPAVEQLAQTLPLDPATRELRDALPADPRATERRLGLREAQGPVVDLRGRLASTREIIDALRPR